MNTINVTPMNICTKYDTVSSNPTSVAQYSPSFQGGDRLIKNAANETSKKGFKLLAASLLGFLGIKATKVVKNEADNKIQDDKTVPKPTEAETTNVLGTKDIEKSDCMYYGGTRKSCIEKTVLDQNGNPKNVKIDSVFFPDGRESHTDYFIDSEEIALDLVKDYEHFENNIDLYVYRGYLSPAHEADKVLKILYNSSLNDIIAKLPSIDPAPSTPVIINDADIPYAPDSQDRNLYGFKRSDAACEYRQKPVIPARQAMPEWQIGPVWFVNTYLDKDRNATSSDFTYLKIDDHPHYIYYNADSNLSTVFDSAGEPVCQIAFNTHYVKNGDKLPTNYKIYSIYDSVNKEFKALK